MQDFLFHGQKLASVEQVKSTTNFVSPTNTIV